MDVSPQTLREVEFREKLRGYNPDDVDEFLERVAAGLEILQERLRQATERAVRAEHRVSETGEGDDAMRRTLVLAQRTADLAVQEAREQAQRIVAEAKNQAQGVRAEAAEHARRAIDEATREAWAQVGRLESARDDLHQEILGLQQYLENERLRLRGVLSDTLRRLDDLVPSMSPPPAVDALDRSSLVSSSVAPSPPPPAPMAAPVPSPTPSRLSDDQFYAELQMAVRERHEERGPNGHGTSVTGY